MLKNIASSILQSSKPSTNNLSYLLSNIDLNSKIIGIDYGTSYIGLSISDQHKIIAKSLHVYNNKIDKTSLYGSGKYNLKNIIAYHNVQFIVLGIPIIANTEDEICEKIRKFGKSIIDNNTINIPIILWDESNSSKITREMMTNLYNIKLSRQKSLGSDKIAATIVLQDFLDYYNIIKQSKNFNAPNRKFIDDNFIMLPPNYKKI